MMYHSVVLYVAPKRKLGIYRDFPEPNFGPNINFSQFTDKISQNEEKILNLSSRYTVKFESQVKLKCSLVY